MKLLLLPRKAATASKKSCYCIFWKQQQLFLKAVSATNRNNYRLSKKLPLQRLAYIIRANRAFIFYT